MNLSGNKILEITNLSVQHTFDHKEPSDSRITWNNYSLKKNKNLINQANIIRVVPNCTFGYIEGLVNTYGDHKPSTKLSNISCTEIILNETRNGSNVTISVGETYEEICSLLGFKQQSLL